MPGAGLEGYSQVDHALSLFFLKGKGYFPSRVICEANWVTAMSLTPTQAGLWAT